MQFTAANGVQLPQIMYGTAWKKEATTDLVLKAVKAGFRAIDTANQLIHYDEALVGKALLSLYEDGLKRDELFLQTKFTSVNGQDHRTPYDAKARPSTQVEQSFASSLEHLHTEVIDSYVLHGPYGRRGLTAEDLEVWQAIEKIYKSGKARIIGVSNFSADQLEELCLKAEIKPMVVQNRCYAVMGWDRDVRDVCAENQIVYQGFSLLTANGRALASPSVRAVATKYGVTMAQLIFRFSLQIGILPLTGTSDQEHMKEDLQALSFELDPQYIKMIEAVATID